MSITVSALIIMVIHSPENNSAGSVGSEDWKFSD
jgi:hypothetical protein